MIASGRQVDGVLGLVDDDFDTLTGAPHAVPNVVSTDPRDLEGILMRSAALEKTLAELGDAARLEAFLAREGGTVRDALLIRADIFSRIRWLNYLQPTRVNLDPLRPGRFCNHATWTYDLPAIKFEAVRLGVATNAAALDQMLAALPAAPAWHIVRGHDLVAVLAGGLHSVLGTSRPGISVVEMTLRASLEQIELCGTSVWAAIKAWEATNQPYVILRQ
jgi:hypothetical protein